MGNLFDALIVLSLIVTVVVCFKLGFIKLLTPFRKIAAFVLAWCLKDTALVRETVGKVFHTEDFKVFLTERVDTLWGEQLKSAASAEGVSLAERFDNIFGFWGTLFGSFKNFCMSLFDSEYQVQDNGALPSEHLDSFVKKVTEYVADAASGFFSVLIGFIALYIIFRVGLWFLAKLLDSIFDRGLLGAVNHTVGGVVGICYGFLIAWILSIVFVFILPLVTTVDITTVTGGFLGITEWFYTKFFLSAIIGMTI